MKSSRRLLSSGLYFTAPDVGTGPVVESTPEARYWRITLFENQSRASNTINSLAEVQLWDTEGGTQLTSGSTPVTASSTLASPTYDPDKVLDGNNATFWASADNANYGRRWLAFDLGTPQAVNHTVIRNRGDGAFGAQEAPITLAIEYSDDNTTWRFHRIFLSAGDWPSAGQTRLFNNPYEGLEPVTTDWKTVLSPTLTNDDPDNWENRSLRIRYTNASDPLAIFDKLADGVGIRITIEGPVSGSAAIKRMFATVEDNRDFGSTTEGIPITFDDGVAAFTLAAGETKVSDVIPITVLRDSSEPLLISAEFTSGAGTSTIKGGDVAGVTARWYPGDTSGPSTGSGWVNVPTYSSYLVKQIEFYPVTWTVPAVTDLMLDGEGADGATSFTASGLAADAGAALVGFRNGAAISTDQARFGTSSFEFVGASNQYLEINDGSTPYTEQNWEWNLTGGPRGTGLAHDQDEWTIEFSVRFNGTPIDCYLASNWAIDGAKGWYIKYTGTTFNMAYTTNGTTNYHPLGDPIPDGGLLANTWHDIAVCKTAGNQIRFFLDGSLLAEGYSRNFYQPNGRPLWLGALRSSGDTVVDSRSFNGHMDNIRLSRTCLYREDYTVTDVSL